MQKFLYYYLDYLAQKKDKQKGRVRYPSLEEMKDEYIAFLLQITEHNIEEAAEILDVSEETLFRKMKEHRHR